MLYEKVSVLFGGHHVTTILTNREMRPEWMRAPKGLIEEEADRMCLRRNYTRSSKCTLRGERETAGQIRSYKYGIDGEEREKGKRVTDSTRGCKYRADELLHPLPMMHDAMLLTLYTPTETTLFPRFLLHYLRLAVPRRSRRDPPSVIYFHLFRPSNPALISFGLVAPCYEAADLAVHFITAQNDFASPPSKILDNVVDTCT